MVDLKVAHTPGLHCASTGLMNIARFHGLSWSEAMCFGIGAGLGIWYLETPDVSPSRLFHVRSQDIETQFFNRIGHPFEWERFDSPEDSEKALLMHLDDERPAILQTDIYYLPYYNSGTHFPGHLITVWGYDDKKQVFFITDTERTDTLEVPFENMKKARFCGGGIFDVKGNMFAPETLQKPENLPRVIQKAIVYNSHLLLDTTNAYQGIPALEKWLAEIPVWADFKDWQWTARFTYQVIEKRGTGGGGFRLLYADFLKEADDLVPDISSLGLAEMMQNAGLCWQELSLSLKDASERSTPDFNDVAEKLEKLIRLESTYHKTAVKLV